MTELFDPVEGVEVLGVVEDGLEVTRGVEVTLVIGFAAGWRLPRKTSV